MEKIFNNVVGAKANPSSTLVNNLVSNNSTSFKSKKPGTNLISMVKEGRNGAVNSSTFSPSNNKNMNLKDSNQETREKANINRDLPFTNRVNNMTAKPDLIPSDIKKLTNENISSKTIVQEAISVTTLMNNQNIPLALSNLTVIFPQYEITKCSSRSIGNISAYAVNTYQGIIRNYNEDRVSIILNIAKPQGFSGVWPKCSFFGIYDGHGGCNCSDFLRDQLHSYVVKDSNFPENPIKALMNGFEKAEKDFILNQALNKNFEIIDRSGSCAIIALIVEDMCYVANVGDSRAVMSSNRGNKMDVITNDHKPNEEGESKRIIENGGKVYQTQTPARFLNIANFNGNGNNSNQVFLGPYRVFPGRLSVSRTFGDVEAKIQKFGGIPGVVIATPEITSFKITDEKDFLVLGCDGIFDQIDNQEVIDCVWMTMDDTTRAKNINAQCALGSDMIMKSSLVRRTLDNVTVAIIAFSNFEKVHKDFSMKKTETLSPKSSLYLYNVIENKEDNVTESAANYYSATEPSIVVEKNIDISLELSKNTTTGVRKYYEDKNSNLRQKYVTPITKENLNLTQKIGSKTNNWPGARNINYISSSKDSSKNSLNRPNKVLSFEISKKIVLSPKNKTSKNILIFKILESLFIPQ